jgi:hypothetical protein
MSTTITFYTLPAHLERARGLIAQFPAPYCEIPLEVDAEHIAIASILRDCAEHVVGAELLLAWTIAVIPDEIPEELAELMQASKYHEHYRSLLTGMQVGGTVYQKMEDVGTQSISRTLHQLDTDSHRAYADLLSGGYELIRCVMTEVSLDQNTLDCVASDVTEMLTGIVPDIGMIASVNESRSNVVMTSPSSDRLQ